MPPGPLLGTVALTNDLHYGEHVSGLLLTGSYRGCAMTPTIISGSCSMPCWTSCAGPDRAVDHLIVAGELTDSGTVEQARAVWSRLDAWGVAGRDYFVCRGNHNHPGRDDHWGSVFHPRGDLLTEHRRSRRRGGCGCRS